MGKYVIETVQVIRRTYLVKVDDPTWAHDAMLEGELEDFSSQFLSEDVVSTRKVEKFSDCADGGNYHEMNYNSAVCVYDPDSNKFEVKARWDIVDKVKAKNEQRKDDRSED